MTLWDDDYAAACAKLKEAEAQHKIANSVYCQSVEQLDHARRAVVRLYRERMKFADGVSEDGK